MAKAIAALGLALLALALAAHAHKSKQTRAFALSPPPELVPGLRESLARADTCLASHGTPWPVYASNVSRPRLHPHFDTRRQERILNEFFTVLLQADDVALLEREASAMGPAYLDTNFTMCRRPVLLRSSVRDIMSKYGMPLTPLERKWTPVAGEPPT